MMEIQTEAVGDMATIAVGLTFAFIAYPSCYATIHVRGNSSHGWLLNNDKTCFDTALGKLERSKKRLCQA
jgi:hypothetical protein